MDLIKVLLIIKNERFTLTFKEGLEGDEFSMKIVLEKTLLFEYKQEYIITDELALASGEEGLAITLDNLLSMVKANIKYSTIPRNP